jgi:LAO/AO transport system kinase
MPVSALDGIGLMQAWEDMQRLAGWRREHGHFTRRRAEQDRHWFEAEVREGLLARLTQDPQIRAAMEALGQSVAAGQTAPSAAAAQMIAQIRNG